MTATVNEPTTQTAPTADESLACQLGPHFDEPPCARPVIGVMLVPCQCPKRVPTCHRHAWASVAEVEALTAAVAKIQRDVAMSGTTVSSRGLCPDCGAMFAPTGLRFEPTP